MSTRPWHIVCAGGGTLGSVTPLLAVVEELRARYKDSIKFSWLGTSDGPELALVSAAGLRFVSMPAGKLRRYWSWDNVVDVGKTSLGFFAAFNWFMENKADVVLTAGGYIAVPVALAAKACHIPVMLHQQDVLLSLTNKILSPLATKVTVALDVPQPNFFKKKAILVGNPVRAGFKQPPERDSACAALGLDAKLPVVLIIGGGTGAKSLNSLVADSLSYLTAVAQVVHLTGVGKLSSQQPNERYFVQEFATDDIPYLAAADLVISRAGMGTITELAALHKPAVIIPIPETHQEANANFLAKHEAAVVLDQVILTPEILVATVRQLLQKPVWRQTLSENIGKIMPSDAAQRLAKEVEKILASHHYRRLRKTKRI